MELLSDGKSCPFAFTLVQSNKSAGFRVAPVTLNWSFTGTLDSVFLKTSQSKSGMLVVSFLLTHTQDFISHFNIFNMLREMIFINYALVLDTILSSIPVVKLGNNLPRVAPLCM